MSKQIVLGQYIPGDSLVHRLDPRVKILATLAYMISIFFIDDFIFFIPVVLYILLVVSICKIKLSRLLKGLRPILMILIITSLFNLFLTPGKIIFTLGPLEMTEEGLIKAIFIALRLTILLAGTSLMTMTTSPMELTQGLEKLFKPLKVIGFPVAELAMMISISLRFIPTLFDESQKIMNAQKARGADFESGNIFSRAKSMVPLLVPLFINSFKRADELSTAMEARCYIPRGKRTKLNEISMDKSDWTISLLLGLFFAFIISSKYIW